MRWMAAAACAAVVGGGIVGAAQQQRNPTGSMGNKMTDAQIIKAASAAAPPAVSRDATIVAMNPDGSMRTIRKGTNGFTCVGDDPNMPGPNATCADQNSMAWLDAYLKKQDPPAGKIGFAYMLAGGTDATNTDPYAQKPPPGSDWIRTGPHVMILGAKGMFDGYPHDAKPDTSQPYIMWAGTPYEHLMAPVK